VALYTNIEAIRKNTLHPGRPSCSLRQLQIRENLADLQIYGSPLRLGPGFLRWGGRQSALSTAAMKRVFCVAGYPTLLTELIFFKECLPALSRSDVHLEGNTSPNRVQDRLDAIQGWRVRPTLGSSSSGSVGF